MPGSPVRGWFKTFLPQWENLGTDQHIFRGNVAKMQLNVAHEAPRLPAPRPPSRVTARCPAVVMCRAAGGPRGGQGRCCCWAGASFHGGFFLRPIPAGGAAASVCPSARAWSHCFSSALWNSYKRHAWRGNRVGNILVLLHQGSTSLAEDTRDDGCPTMLKTHPLS